MFNEFLMQQGPTFPIDYHCVNDRRSNWSELPPIALKVDLVYLRQEGSRDQVLLDVRL